MPKSKKKNKLIPNNKAIILCSLRQQDYFWDKEELSLKSLSQILF